MKWDDDEYRVLKWDIFNILRASLKEEHAEKISIKHASDCIDRFMEELTKPSENDK